MAISKLILLKLIDNADNYGRCFPSYRYLADYCEISERTVRGHVKRLESLGFVEKIKRFDKKSEISCPSKKAEALSQLKTNLETDIAALKIAGIEPTITAQLISATQ